MAFDFKPFFNKLSLNIVNSVELKKVFSSQKFLGTPCGELDAKNSFESKSILFSDTKFLLYVKQFFSLGHIVRGNLRETP
jgi:hypothetical protein